MKGLERTFRMIWPWAGTCREWDENIKDGKMGILVTSLGFPEDTEKGQHFPKLKLHGFQAGAVTAVPFAVTR